MPYQNKEGDKNRWPWIGQIVVNGKKRKKRCLTKREAIQWEEEERKRVDESMKEKPITLADLEAAYIEFARGRFSPGTVDEKRLAFRLLFETIDRETPAANLKPIQVLNHLKDQAGRRSGNAANKQRKNLSAAWSWGNRYLGLPEQNPFQKVAKFAEDRKERRVPSLDEFWMVFRAASCYQDKVMLLAYLQTGARRDELFRLRWKDVDLIGKRVRLYWKKNQAGQWQSAWLPIKDELVEMLIQQKQLTGHARLVFSIEDRKDPKKRSPYQYRNKWLPTLCRRAGVEPFGLHGIRHLFASILAAANVPLVEIQKMLRHGSIATTARYIHTLKKENREVLTALPGVEKNPKTPEKTPEEVNGFRPV